MKEVCVWLCGGAYFNDNVQLPPVLSSAIIGA